VACHCSLKTANCLGEHLTSTDVFHVEQRQQGRHPALGSGARSLDHDRPTRSAAYAPRSDRHHEQAKGGGEGRGTPHQGAAYGIDATLRDEGEPGLGRRHPPAVADCRTISTRRSEVKSRYSPNDPAQWPRRAREYRARTGTGAGSSTQRQSHNERWLRADDQHTGPDHVNTARQTPRLQAKSRNGAGTNLDPQRPAHERPGTGQQAANAA
jgi:hypothetical protein